ncbi:tetratricopeptide repeat protein [bacterium]|nr:tetratricopeptide repeat protein [bacterium]
MELTLDQALRKAVEAHKAGELQEAKSYYTIILKANPNHPDANHNMGVLAVGIGQVAGALIFLKRALDAKPGVAQYWLSYIDALIKIDRVADAKAVFDQARKKGAKGDAFDQIEKRIVLPPYEKSAAQEPTEEQLQSLINLYSQGQHQQALTQVSQLLEKFSESVNLYNILGAANQQLGKLDQAVLAYKNALLLKPDYADAYYNLGNALHKQGKLDEAIESYNKALLLKPDYALAYYNLGNTLKDQGNVDEAIMAYNKALSLNPDFAEAYNNMGSAFRSKGKLEEAIGAYNKALSLKPNYAGSYSNLGNALQKQGKLKESIEAYKKAVSINPNNANDYNNMGVSLRSQGELERAITSFKQAISIKPDYARAHSNLGVTLQDQGILKAAIVSHRKALSFKPDFVDAYYNMGNAFLAQNKLEDAIDAFNKALSIKPDFAEAYWNLSGTADTISEAKKWLEKCLKAEPQHLKAKLTLSAVKFYEGDQSEFGELIKSSHNDHPYTRSFAWAFNLPKLPTLHFHRWALFDHMTRLSKKDRPFYEFGVWRGEAFRHLIKTFREGFGFDTFEGIPEDWHDEKAGTYSSNGNVPEIKGGEFIVGKFEDTLPDFFADERPMASIINFDADLYSSTICALNFVKPVIDKHTILIFDEFIINKNWEQDEYKALEEFCVKNQYTYEVLAISFFTKQVAVKIIGV